MLAARICLTISAFLFAAGPIWVDLSTSHVFNADWPPHARFHMVWLLALLAVAGGVTVLGAWLIKRHQTLAMKLVILPGWAVLVPFFVAVLAVETYGGSLSDLADAPKVLGLDGNIFGFSLSAIFQGAASYLIWRQ
ncbi:MAG: DUF6640 family protein [Pseudomonadota bacterium]